MDTKTKTQQRDARRRRIRAKIFGTASRPRLSVHRSNTRLRAQIINDDEGTTLVAVSSADGKSKTPGEQIREAGKAIAELAKSAKITSVVFDRGGFAYKGNIKIFAEAAREAGLKF